MRPCTLVRCWWLFAGVVAAVPGVGRRQNQTPTDTCTCPADGPATTTVVRYTLVTSFITTTMAGGTVYSTGATATRVTTITSASTITITTGTSTITEPGFTQTTTMMSTIISTVTASTTVTTCTVSAVPKLRRQAVSSDPSPTPTQESFVTTIETTDTRPTVTFTSTLNSRVATCVCTPVSQATTMRVASSCSCPATTTATVTVSSVSTGVVLVTVVTATPTVVVITPSVQSTFIYQNTVTSSVLATVQTTPGPSAVTERSTTTVYTTVTSTFTVNSCSTTTTLRPSSTSTRSSSTTSSAVGPTSSAPGSLPCNSTAYFVQTTNSVVSFYNIDLKSGNTFIVNNNLGGGAYININGMGLNPLDNFLYGIGTISTGNYAVIRISINGVVTSIYQFTASAAPGTVGDIDTNGQFWFSGSGTSWYQVDLAPGSSTYGKLIASGTMTLTGYNVYDWSYLPGQGGYLWTLASSTDSTPYLGILRWSMTAHTWSVYEAFTGYPTTGNFLATWGSNNSTLWGFQSTSGKILQLTVGGNPIALSNGPIDITNGDGARCALTA